MMSLLLMTASAVLTATLFAIIGFHHHGCRVPHPWTFYAIQFAIPTVLGILAAHLAIYRLCRRPLPFPRCYWFGVFAVFGAVWFSLISGVIVTPAEVPGRTLSSPHLVEEDDAAHLGGKQDYTLWERPWLLHRAYLALLNGDFSERTVLLMDMLYAAVAVVALGELVKLRWRTNEG